MKRHINLLSVLFALSVLASCAPTPTLEMAEPEIQLYVALNGDVILESPRPVNFGNVRVAADSVTSPYLLSPEPSVYGYFALVYPDEEANYPNCLRIAAENPTAGWAGVTMVDDDYSEAEELDTRPKRAPEGC